MEKEVLYLVKMIFHQIVIASDFGLGSARPGLVLKFPFDKNMDDIVNLVFGVSLAVNLK